ncbi:MAG: haloacid dehalogenase type II [Candidatus Thioglobus sp.]
MPISIAFDIYGTLIDTNGVVALLDKMIGSNSRVFSQTWRDKQLEYSFRRGLMQDYKNFSVCTSNSLDFTCAYYKIKLTDVQKQELLDKYRVLPAFNDVKDSLVDLNAAGFRMYALSNGSTEAIETLLTTATIRDYFIDVVSADEIETFKPNPAVYNHFLKRAKTSETDAWLISSNPFDVIGAISVGMKAAWVKRSQEIVFDPWGVEPTITITNLSEILDRLEDL